MKSFAWVFSFVLFASLATGIRDVNLEPPRGMKVIGKIPKFVQSRNDSSGMAGQAKGWESTVKYSVIGNVKKAELKSGIFTYYLIFWISNNSGSSMFFDECEIKTAYPLMKMSDHSFPMSNIMMVRSEGGCLLEFMLGPDKAILMSNSENKPLYVLVTLKLNGKPVGDSYYTILPWICRLFDKNSEEEGFSLVFWKNYRD